MNDSLTVYDIIKKTVFISLLIFIPVIIAVSLDLDTTKRNFYYFLFGWAFCFSPVWCKLILPGGRQGLLKKIGSESNFLRAIRYVSANLLILPIVGILYALIIFIGVNELLN